MINATLYAPGLTVEVLDRAGPLPPPSPSPIGSVAAGAFITLTGATIASVVPNPKFYDQYHANSSQDVRGVVTAWGGARLSADGKMRIRGGGGLTYGGNEDYALDPIAGTMVRETDPSPLGAPDPATGLQIPAYGPMARHTYDGLCALPDGRDVLYGGNVYPTDTAGDSHFRWRDQVTKLWTDTGVSLGGQGTSTPSLNYWKNGVMICALGTNGYAMVDTKTEPWTVTSHSNRGPTGAVPAVPGVPSRMMIVGDICYVMLSSKNWGFWNLATLSGWNVLTLTGDLDLPVNCGVDYDPVAQKAIAWNGSDTTWLIDFIAKTSTKTAGTQPAASGSGIFGRWRYLQPLDAFVGYPTDISKPGIIYFPRGSL